jgi:hypothetical protein
MMNFPPVRPLPILRPWSAPQTADPTAENRRLGVAAASGALIEARRAAAIREAHRYATINGSIAYSITTQPQQVLAASQNYRNFLAMRNNGAANIFIDFGRDASSVSTILLIPNQIILFDTVVPQDDVSAIGAAASQLSLSFSSVNFLESEI